MKEGRPLGRPSSHLVTTGTTATDELGPDRPDLPGSAPLLATCRRAGSRSVRDRIRAHPGGSGPRSCCVVRFQPERREPTSSARIVRIVPDRFVRPDRQPLRHAERIRGNPGDPGRAFLLPPFTRPEFNPEPPVPGPPVPRSPVPGPPSPVPTIPRHSPPQPTIFHRGLLQP
jgi:hypothetical protein